MIEASVGSVWSDLRVEYVALTPDFTKFRESDWVSLRATVEGYRGPIRSLRILTSGEAFTITTVWLDEDAKATGVEFHASMDSRVDSERIEYALDENIEALGRRKSSNWYGATSRKSRSHHVTAGELDSDGPSVIRARSLRTRFRRLIVIYRDQIIIGLATGFVASISIIVLQLLKVIPVPS
ncbi:hypothetical protein [Microbacterium oleivorans]|uniref:Uncharacterized protein n=1 Tax=Microbacterium oleivorans TaxID=273677 RepID=A0A177KEA4_9MICO|nr:hypothetical protein [Microbacterium oleivorans]OAH51366.1 hypothetical protein AYL44_03625 [Microbacterium oleivorans]